MVEIITEKNQWFSVLQQFEQYDSYHTYDYHAITKNASEQPILLNYTEENKTIAIPLLIKDIKGTVYKDATSVYGYAGPLTKNISNDFDNTYFKNQLHDFLLDNNVISVFSRLHPFIPRQHSVLKNIGEITKTGNIVNIDISQDIDTQKRAYHKRLRTYINKSRKIYSVSTAKTKHEVHKFIDIYYENMHRVNADPSYFFKDEYFSKLLGSNDFKTEILLATCNSTKKAIAGAMFLKNNHIVQYHLAGCIDEYLHLNAVKLLIDEARIMASNEKYTYFNLGGGKGAKEDSLFYFKSGFSKDFKPFSLWKYIVNHEVYFDMVNEKLNSVPLECQPQYLINFPHYRDYVS